MKAKTKGPSAPHGLPVEARAWWERLQKGYVIVDEGGLALLEQAARSFARVEAARKILDADGLVLADRFGQQRAHPAAAIERDARSGLLQALKALGLDLDVAATGLPGRGHR